MNKTLLFLLLPGLLISCKPTPPSGDNGEIVPLTSECLLKNSDLYKGGKTKCDKLSYST